MHNMKGWPVAAIRFTETMEVLSSAVLNGGMAEADAVFIMEVPKDFECENYMALITDVRDSLGLPENSVGMMTAAEVDQVFNVKSSVCRGVEVTAFATAGLANHVIAGEELTDYERKSETSMKRMRALRPGTINIGVVSPKPLTLAAKVNIMNPIVEGKTVAMFRQGFLETGTTSDSVAVFSPRGSGRENWTGTGSDIGIAAARAVIDAVGWALRKRDEHPAPLEPREALERMGISEECLYSASDRSLSREDFGKRLDDVLSEKDAASVLDLAYTVMYRADSMAEDGKTGDLETVVRMLCVVFGIPDLETRDVRTAVFDAIVKRMSEDSDNDGGPSNRDS